MAPFKFLRATAIALVLSTSTYYMVTTYTRRRSSLNQSIIKHRTREVVKKIESQTWADLRLDFIAPIRLFLSETLLEKGWNIVHRSFGPIESVEDPIITPGWFLSTVKIPLKLQHADFGLQLLMTPGGSLVGLHFTGLGEGWQTPSYGHSTLVEIDMLVGPDQLKVGATLCLPCTSGEASSFPCVVFLSGSGPCDRDSTIGVNKPLKDLALGLASRGIASVRFDKVTRTHAKVLRGRNNFTLTDEYVVHAIDTIRQSQNHPNIDANRVFILGHSLGAVVAPKLAAMDTSIAGCIVMAGPAEPIYKCYVRQLQYIESLDGPDSLYLSKQIEDAREKAEMADSEDLTLSTPAKKLPFGIGAAYWLDYLKFKPIETIKELNTPTLIMQGCRDYQVTTKDDYWQWHDALCDRENVQFRLYEELNHMFIAGKGLSTPLEYSIQGNVDERVVVDIAEWIFKLS